MWTSITQFEYELGSSSASAAGGVAPLRYELARHAYLERRLAHAEMDRHSKALALWTTIFQWAQHTAKLHCQTAPHGLKVRMERAAPETA